MPAAPCACSATRSRRSFCVSETMIGSFPAGALRSQRPSNSARKNFLYAVTNARRVFAVERRALGLREPLAVVVLAARLELLRVLGRVPPLVGVEVDGARLRGGLRVLGE